MENFEINDGAAEIITKDTRSMVEQAIAFAGAITYARRTSLEIAASLGATQAVLNQIAKANHLSRGKTINVPARYIRGNGWARLGFGQDVQWGEKNGSEFKLDAPGKWVCYSSDGFKRNEKVTWTVTHIEVVPGTIWSIAE